MIEIAVPKFKSHNHHHLCPLCKKVRYECNDICRKESGDHKFPCVGCLQDYRRRFGSFSDDLLEPFISPVQRSRIPEVVPDSVSDFLDQRDDFRRATQEYELETKPKPIVELSPEEAFRIEKEKREELIDTADKLTWDETRAELEKIQKEEKL